MSSSMTAAGIGAALRGCQPHARKGQHLADVVVQFPRRCAAAPFLPQPSIVEPALSAFPGIQDLLFRLLAFGDVLAHKNHTGHITLCSSLSGKPSV